MSNLELEKLRKKARNFSIINKVLLNTFPTFPFVFIFMYLTVDFEPSRFETYLIILLCLFIITVTGILSTNANKKFSLALKKTYVLKKLYMCFDNLEYEFSKNIEDLIEVEIRMIEGGNRYFATDYISAKYKNVNVIFSDINIALEKRSNTVFEGKLFIFDFNKKFKSNIIVCQNGFYNINKEGNYNKILTEDFEFNKLFTVYTQSNQEAFYILTPSLMEKIKKIATNIDGIILFMFVNNKLHIRIKDGKDSFDHSLFKTIDETKVVEEVSKDIKLITDFVDELDLDNDLFRKEV